MKKLSEIFSEQHREKGRFKPTIPRMVPNKPNASPRADSDSANVSLRERCWTGYRQIGLKKKGDRMVPNCVQDSVEIPSDAPSIETIAKKHGVSKEEIEKQLKIGMKVEAEHGKSKGSEREIALDHLNEKPDYYKQLKKFVEEFGGKEEMQVQGTAAMTLVTKPNKEPMKKLKEASAAAIAAATAISKKKSGNYDKKGMRVKPYKNPDAPNVKSNAERRKEMNEAKDVREYDYEGDMAKTQLKTIIRNAQNMHDMLDEDANLPEWVQSKITLAKDYIVTAANYLESEMNEEVKKSDIPAYLRKQQGKPPLKLSDLKRKDTISDKENLAKLREEQHKEIDVHTEVEDGSHQDKNDTKDLHDRIKAAAKKHGATITYQDRPSLRGSHTISARGSHDFHKEVKKISSDYEHLGVQHEINEGAVPAKEKTVMVRHKTSGKELVVTQQKAKELQKHDYHPVKEEVEIDEGTQQILRKFVPGYAKHQLNKKMDAQAYAPGDSIKKTVNKDINYGRYKKIYDKLKKEEVEQIDELSNDTLKSYLKNKKEVEGGGVGRQGSGYSYEKSEDGTRSAIRRIQARKNQIGKYGEVPKVPGYNKEEVEQIDEKNVPTSPEKWARAKAQAKAKFDVYPSAYANGWAAKKYKEMGGGWKSVSEAKEPPFDKPYTTTKGTITDKSGAKHTPMSRARDIARMAMKKQAETMKKMPMKEETRKAAIVKEVMKKKKASEDAFQKDPELSTTLTKV